MKIKPYVTLLVIILLSGAFITTSAGAWIMFQHDAQNTGYTSSIGPVMSQILWDSTTDETIAGISYSSPSFSKGRMYIGCTDGALLCLDAFPDEHIYEEGDPDEGPIIDPPGAPYDFIWRFYTNDSITSSPLIHQGKVYFGSLDGYVHCIYSCIGTEIARYKTDGPVTSSPVLQEPFIYIGSEDGHLYCFNTNNGLQHTWEFSAGSAIRTSPAIAQQFVVFGTDQGLLYAVNANNGTYAWSFESGSSFRSSPVVKENSVLIGSEEGILYSVNVDTGSLNWEFPTGNSIIGTPAVHGNTVVVSTVNGRLYALTLANGSKLWEKQVVGDVYSSLLIAKHHVYICSGNQVSCFLLENGVAVWSKVLDGVITSSPAVVDSHLFVATESGSIYCFRNHNPPLIPRKPVGPTYGIIDKEYEFTFQTTDPEGDLIYYQIEWEDETTTEWFGPFQSGDVLMKTRSFRFEGDHSIRVRAKDRFDYESAWSEPHFITINILDITNIRGGLGIHATLENKGMRQLWKIKWTIDYVGGRVLNPANDHCSGEFLNLPAGESVAITTGPFFEVGRIRFTISVLDKDNANQHSITMKAFSFGYIVILLPW